MENVKRFLTGKLNFCGPKQEMEKRRIRREKPHFVAERNGLQVNYFLKQKKPQYIGWAFVSQKNNIYGRLTNGGAWQK